MIEMLKMYIDLYKDNKINIDELMYNLDNLVINNIE